MKVAQIAATNSGYKVNDPVILPLIPTEHEYAECNLVSFKLRMVPAEANSQTCNFKVPLLNGLKNCDALFSGHKT